MRFLTFVLLPIIGTAFVSLSAFGAEIILLKFDTSKLSSEEICLYKLSSARDLIVQKVKNSSTAAQNLALSQYMQDALVDRVKWAQHDLRYDPSFDAGKVEDFLMHRSFSKRGLVLFRKQICSVSDEKLLEAVAFAFFGFVVWDKSIDQQLQIAKKFVEDVKVE